MNLNDSKYTSIPVGKLGICALQSCNELGKKVDQYIVDWRTRRTAAHNNDTSEFDGYLKDSYLLSAACPRFGSGEAKGIFHDSVRGNDVYLLVDVLNHSITYKLCGQPNRMSPDDHYSDLKRMISATCGKANKVNVIMPFLYEGRQHKRSARESLDCASMLQELFGMGVDNLITFDAHDPRVMNAIPASGFETVQPTYQFVKALLSCCDDLQIDKDHMMTISPDEGATNRAIYFSSVLGVDMGMFYKRRDYSTIIDGRNPIVAHEFLGDSVEGKDVIILDDMISSGDSMIDVAKQLKDRKARRVFCLSTFGLFTNGLDRFDEAFEQGLIHRVITTNATYQNPELFTREWYVSADISKYIALIIDNMNHNASISELLDPTERIRERIEEYKAGIRNCK
ncbi:MAG: ribose-phosphate pyrophosphokinase [Lachnospiraceae bacterium]|nr:ribose-phosphate pyrophosphokinase [Lachnospiraceae bacterium]